MDFSDQYMQDLGDFLNPTMSDYDVSASIGPIATEVQFLNVDDSTVVHKYQSRVRKEAKQRLKHADVHILVTSPYDVKTIRAWVQREEKATELFAYDVGRVEFAARDIVFKGSQSVDNGFGTKNLYEIDLDAIYYDNLYDKRPVYKLAKTDMLNRNRFQVLVQVIFADNTFSNEFVSPAFYCCTQPKVNTKRKTRSSNDGKQFTKGWNESDLYNNSQVVDYFEANEAVIGTLEVKGTLHGPKHKADIAYHFDINPSEFQKTLKEGDVVGLNTKANGETALIELSPTNIDKVIQAGVISRSAFFEGNIPTEKAVTTDKICVMGMVKVRIIGDVKSGSRVYASTRYPGKAVSEAHPWHVENDLLLGMAMESSEGNNEQGEHLVRCFVSFLCGISGKFVSDKTQELVSQTDTKIEMAIDQKWRDVKGTVMVVVTFSTLLLCFIVFLAMIYSS